MYKNILLLNGSTRINGNSLTICNSLSNIMKDKDIEVSIENIQEYFNKKDIKVLSNKLNDAQVIGIVSPLYVDTFPYPVIDFLEKLEENYGQLLQGKKLFFIGQCNFPESRRVTPMMLSCKCFAKATNMIFLGGMAYGGSVIRIEGRTLEDAGKEGERMLKALALAVDNITEGKEISEEAKNLFKNDVNLKMLKPFTIVANIMFQLIRIKIKKKTAL